MADVAYAGPSRLAGRSAALDGLRGLAVLAVFAFHIGGFLSGARSSFVAGGGLGVDLFFVLSGFLITSLLLAERVARGRIDFSAFYLRRALRLFPPLFVLLAALLVYAAVTSLDFRDMLKAALLVGSYVFNWAAAAKVRTPFEVNHLWSLSIEEQFYLAWPLVVLGLGKLRPRMVVPALVVAAALSAADRLVLFSRGNNLAHLRTDCRVDSLLLGAVVAVLAGRGELRAATCGVLGAVGAFVLAFLVFVPDSLFGGQQQRIGFLCKGGYTLVAVSCAAMVAAVASNAWSGQRLLTWPPLCTIGRTSYALYLWHAPILIGMIRHTQSWPDPLRVVCAIAFSAAATVASWYLVERPARRLRSVIESRRRLDNSAEVAHARPSRDAPD
jgi:peptidoglycan/LPS O-acetylase OafA/YrhL